MIRAYKIINNTFTPVTYDPDIEAVYISDGLFAQLYAASSDKLKEAQEIFAQRLNTAEFQIICLTGDDWKQLVEEYNVNILPTEVPVNKIYKVGG